MKSKSHAEPPRTTGGRASSSGSAALIVTVHVFFSFRLLLFFFFIAILSVNLIAPNILILWILLHRLRQKGFLCI